MTGYSTRLCAVFPVPNQSCMQSLKLKTALKTGNCCSAVLLTKCILLYLPCAAGQKVWKVS